MGVIQNLAAQIGRVFRRAGQAFTRGTKTTIEQTFGRESLSKGETVRDVIQTIAHVDPEAIATKLNQTTRTTARLLETEASTVAWPLNQAIPRNLIVSGRLKPARNYRIFYQAQPEVNDAPMGARQWYSIYTNDLKTFGEYELDIVSNLSRTRSSESFSLGEITFHHVLHQRGADF